MTGDFYMFGFIIDVWDIFEIFNCLIFVSYKHKNVKKLVQLQSFEVFYKSVAWF